MCVLARAGGVLVFLSLFLYVCEGRVFLFVFCLGLLLVLLLCLVQLGWSVLGIIIWIQAQSHKMLD